jgi:hypothetical protein
MNPTQSQTICYSPSQRSSARALTSQLTRFPSAVVDEDNAVAMTRQTNEEDPGHYSDRAMTARG